MKMYSLHHICDGKWEVTLHIRQNDDYRFSYEPRPDICAIISDNYEVELQEMAKILIEQVLHCDAVEVRTLSGQGLYVERHDSSENS